MAQRPYRLLPVGRLLIDEVVTGERAGQHLGIDLGIGREGVEAAANIRGALEILDYNEKFIELTLAVLMAPE